MIIFGIILLVIGFFAHIPVLVTIGLVVAALGLVFMVVGSRGHALAGRRHYW